jgi:hypothetical protein
MVSVRNKFLDSTEQIGGQSRQSNGRKSYGQQINIFKNISQAVLRKTKGKTERFTC